MAETSEVTARDSLRRVLANRNLRRVQLAFFGSVTGDWAYATALTVWAYTQGGAAAVGAFTAARFVAMAVAGPLGAAVADKVSRKTFMIVTDLVRAGMVSGAAVIVAVDGPAFLVYGLGVLTAMVGAPFRSAQAGLIPKLVNRPDELTASNAVAANLENVATFAGPALGALLVGLVRRRAGLLAQRGHLSVVLRPRGLDPGAGRSERRRSRRRARGGGGGVPDHDHRRLLDRRPGR